MKILMVCLGNICRSPLAEGIMKSKLTDDFEVDSAGTIAYHEGKKPDDRSIKVAANHGLNISRQRSRIILLEDLENFDRIFCMDLKNLQDVESMAKNEEQQQKISLILEEAGNYDDNIEVPDPYWGTMPDFENVFQMLDEACEKIVKKISCQ